MPLTRWQPLRNIELWEPWREMESLQKEMNHLFDKFLYTGNGDSQITALAPSLEMEETPNSIRLKLELPGMEAKDIDIQVTKDSVKITGERKEETKTEEKGMVRSEFRYGKFERMIPLAVNIQNDKVTAEYKNGILQLTLPKLEEDMKKVVKVNLS
ncbi:heat shock protein Hsp20 [Rivularia sp. IAM M-261]|nr:heat shock protein Hsp20 [Rivularia sp. IAM M-261]